LTVGVHASLSAGNLRATLIEHRLRFPAVETCLIDGSSNHLIGDLASSTIDVAFVAEDIPRWNGRSLSVWSERIVVALPEGHPLNNQDPVHWRALKQESLLLPQRGAGPEILKLLVHKLACPGPCRLLRHDVSLDCLLTLVAAGWGIVLALEGATGATYPGIVFREVHDDNGPTRLNFRAYWRGKNANPSLRAFLDILRERYPDLSGEPIAG